MSQPVLAIMAAGMGSRFGGLKQIEPVGPGGQIIMDYSLFDAFDAGFRDVCFIIREELRDAFEEAVFKQARERMRVSYVCQSTDRLPGGRSPIPGRTKPFGTGHAVWSLLGSIHAPFAVINADDYYGKEAFRLLHSFLSDANEEEALRCCMVGYRLENTLTENGSVSRGLCRADSAGNLTGIREREAIERRDERIVSRRADGSLEELSPDAPVSMNVWGFTPPFLAEADRLFGDFYEGKLADDPLRAEYYLPSIVDRLIAEDKASVRLMETPDKWHGVTYPEDLASVREAFAEMTEAGRYPASF